MNKHTNLYFITYVELYDKYKWINLYIYGGISISTNLFIMHFPSFIIEQIDCSSIRVIDQQT